MLPTTDKDIVDRVQIFFCDSLNVLFGDRVDDGRVAVYKIKAKTVIFDYQIEPAILLFESMRSGKLPVRYDSRPRAPCRLPSSVRILWISFMTSAMAVFADSFLVGSPAWKTPAVSARRKEAMDIIGRPRLSRMLSIRRDEKPPPPRI